MPELKVQEFPLAPLLMQNPYSKLCLDIIFLFISAFLKCLLQTVTNVALTIGKKKITCFLMDKLI